MSLSVKNDLVSDTLTPGVVGRCIASHDGAFRFPCPPTWSS